MTRLKQALVCIALVFLLLGMFGSIAKPVRAQDNETLKAEFKRFEPTTVTVGEDFTLRAHFFIPAGPDGEKEDQSGATVSMMVKLPGLREPIPIGPVTTITETDLLGTESAQASFDYKFLQPGTYPLSFVIQGSWSDGDTLPPMTFDGGSITAVGAPGAGPLTAKFVSSTTSVVVDQNFKLNAYFQILPATGDPSVNQDGAKVTFLIERPGGPDKITAYTDGSGMASIPYIFYEAGTYPITYVIERDGGDEGTLPPTTFHGSITVDKIYVAPQAPLDVYHAAVEHGVLHWTLAETGLLAIPAVAVAAAIIGVVAVVRLIRRNVSRGKPPIPPEPEKDIFQWFNEHWEEAQNRPEFEK